MLTLRSRITLNYYWTCVFYWEMTLVDASSTGLPLKIRLRDYGLPVDREYSSVRHSTTRRYVVIWFDLYVPFWFMYSKRKFCLTYSYAFYSQIELNLDGTIPCNELRLKFTRFELGINCTRRPRNYVISQPRRSKDELHESGRQKVRTTQVW